MRTRLTAKILAALKPGEIVRDETVRGLFAEGGKDWVSFKVQADVQTGDRGPDRKLRRRTFKHTLGRYPELTLDAARAEALRLLSEVRAGRDPRQGTAAAPRVWTVECMRDEYLTDLEIRQRAERTRVDVLDWFARYLADWLPLPVTHVTRAMARERHAHITREHGPVAANHALKAFRTAYNLARKVHDTPLPENPADAVTYAPERAAHRSIAPVDLASWYARLGKIPNPGRRLMHEVGLFSGLRPGNLVTLERAWIDLAARVVVIPAERMKARREFHLPLSGHLVSLLTRALAWSREMRSDSVYLWPTRSNDGSEWIATQVWRERTMPSETGHLLRHTYSNAARLAGVDDVDRELLLAHRIPGVQGTYLHTPTLFGRLLDSQERVTAWLLAQITPRNSAQG
jgi:integrase